MKAIVDSLKGRKCPAISIDDFDEFGYKKTTLYVMQIPAAKKLRDELNEAINECENEVKND